MIKDITGFLSAQLPVKHDTHCLIESFLFLQIITKNGTISVMLHLQFYYSEIYGQSIKPGLYIVVAEHACDDASKKIIKPSTYRLQIFLVRDQYLPSLLLHGEQAIAGQLKKTCSQAYACDPYDLYGDQALVNAAIYENQALEGHFTDFNSLASIAAGEIHCSFTYKRITNKTAPISKLTGCLF